ncbi:MAG: galactokinase [Parvibaculum sp.]|nr:galactokinase [Parvibaculum sp.]
MNSAFRDVYGRDCEVVGMAPGRVNLIGDHTDYADGYCLPMPLAHVTEVAMAVAPSWRVTSLTNGETFPFDPDGPPRGDWTDYIAGSLLELRNFGIAIRSADVLVRSSVPQGAGVSSSAALEVAVIRAALMLAGEEMADTDVARLAQRAENQYCGVQCGILDQMACAVGRAGEALLLDCRSNKTRNVSVPSSFHFAVIHCGQERRLVDGVYNERRTSVEEAARSLGVIALRDATIVMVDRMPDGVMRKRAQHVVSENERVLAATIALEKGDAERFGQLMLESHRSLAEDFEVSVPALDRLVASAVASGAYGARLTGAGFGGCIVALVPSDDVSAWWTRLSAVNPEAWVVQL